MLGYASSLKILDVALAPIVDTSILLVFEDKLRLRYPLKDIDDDQDSFQSERQVSENEARLLSKG